MFYSQMITRRGPKVHSGNEKTEKLSRHVITRFHRDNTLTVITSSRNSRCEELYVIIFLLHVKRDKFTADIYYYITTET